MLEQSERKVVAASARGKKSTNNSKNNQESLLVRPYSIAQSRNWGPLSPLAATARDTFSLARERMTKHR